MAGFFSGLSEGLDRGLQEARSYQELALREQAQQALNRHRRKQLKQRLQVANRRMDQSQTQFEARMDAQQERFDATHVDADQARYNASDPATTPMPTAQQLDSGPVVPVAQALQLQAQARQNRTSNAIERKRVGVAERRLGMMGDYYDAQAARWGDDDADAIQEAAAQFQLNQPAPSESDTFAPETSLGQVAGQAVALPWTAASKAVDSIPAFGQALYNAVRGRGFQSNATFSGMADEALNSEARKQNRTQHEAILRNVTSAVEDAVKRSNRVGGGAAGATSIIGGTPRGQMLKNDLTRGYLQLTEGRTLSEDARKALKSRYQRAARVLGFDLDLELQRQRNAAQPEE